MRITLHLVGMVFVALFAAQAIPAAGQGKSGAQAGATPPAQRLICRATEETGSLIARRRQCFTRAQWDRMAEAARLRGEDMRSTGTPALPGGN